MSDDLVQISFVPEELIARLIQLGTTLSKSSWEIGDITNQIYVLSLAHGKPHTKLQICHLVGQVLGKSGRTIRGYAAAAEFYSPEIRLEFDVLPFAHFSFAMQFRDVIDNVPMYLRILQRSKEYLDTRGLLPSVESLGFMLQISDKSSPVQMISPPAPARSNGHGEASPSVEDDFQPVEYSARDPDYLPPHPDECSPEEVIEYRKNEADQAKQDLLTAFSDVESRLSGISSSLEKLVSFPEYRRVSAEAAQILVRIRRMGEALRGEPGAYYQYEEMIPE